MGTVRKVRKMNTVDIEQKKEARRIIDVVDVEGSSLEFISDEDVRGGERRRERGRAELVETEVSMRCALTAVVSLIVM